MVTTVGTSVETYVAGSTLNSSNTYSMILSKYTSSGSLSWSATFDVNTAGNVHVGAIALDGSGNILVTGSAYNGSVNNYDLFTVKYNSSGTKQWHQLYNGAANSYDFGTAVTCASNGDVFVTGGTFQSALNMDAVIIRYNSSGTAQWTKIWDNVGLTDACGTIALSSSVVIVTGFSQVNLTTWEYAALRYDQSTGSLLGSYVTSQGGIAIEHVNAAAFDNSGNIYITGAVGAAGQQLNIKTIKLDANLNILWTATYNGAANKDDVGRNIAVDASGNVYVAGYTTGAGDRDAIMLKYNSSGSQTWSQVYDAGEGDDEYADLALTSSGEPFVGGYVTQKGNKDFFAALYNSSGSVRWWEAYNGIYNKNDAIQQVTPDGSGNFIVAGPSGLQDSHQGVMTVKYALHTLVKPQNEEVNAPFTENRGQTLDTDDEPVDNIRYYTRSMYPNVYIFDDKVSYVFAHIDTVPATQDTMARLDLSFAPTLSQAQTGRTQVAVGLERQEAFHNYYLGHIPEGRERVPLENKVLQPSIYTNIDALYGQGQDGLFIRLICKPDSDPADIKLAFTGQTALSMQGDGSLKVETALEDLVLPRPTAMTVGAEGTETAITAWQPSYSISSGVVSITIGSYDPTKTLVIKTGKEREEEEVDDTYWSTYYGGSNEDETTSLEVDKDDGDIFFTGGTTSTNFPTELAIQGTLGGKRDAFAGRFNYQGVRRWVTYYGGTQTTGGPSLMERGLDIAIGNSIGFEGDASDKAVYFVGYTDEWNFPLQQNPPAYFDDFFDPFQGLDFRGFIVKLKKVDGTREWATFFGDGEVTAGSHPEPQEMVTIARINSSGQLVIGGTLTVSGDWVSFPTMPNPPNANGKYSQLNGTAFIAEFGLNDELTWATQLACDGTRFKSHDIALDNSNNIYIVGRSNDYNYCTNTFPLLAPPDGYLQIEPVDGGIKVDGWIMKFDQERKLVWSTYFGGSGSDGIHGAVTDAKNNLYIVGYTESSDLPVKDLADAYFEGNLNGPTDIFIAKFNSDAQLEYLTYFGGSGEENYTSADYQVALDGGIAVWTGERLIITGSTKSTDFPVFNNTQNNKYFYQNLNKGWSSTDQDGFLAIFSEGLQQEFCTYWGGEKEESSKEIAFGNAFGQTYVVIGGRSNTNSAIFERRIPLAQEVPFSYYQNQNAGNIDGFVSKIRLDEILSGTSTTVIKDAHISIFPVPASELIIVELKDSPDVKGEVYSIQLFDVLGRQIAVPATQTGALRWHIDMRHIPSGSYVLQFSEDRASSTHIIIKL